MSPEQYFTQQAAQAVRKPLDTFLKVLEPLVNFAPTLIISFYDHLTLPASSARVPEADRILGIRLGVKSCTKQVTKYLRIYSTTVYNTYQYPYTVRARHESQWIEWDILTVNTVADNFAMILNDTKPENGETIEEYFEKLVQIGLERCDRYV